jgi:energy-coupling factor transporter ATP-binding protein EcfA2
MRISADNLAISYGETTVFSGLSFEADSGEIIAVTGRNGSGKSSLCLALAGIFPDGAVCSGSVYIDGEDITMLSVRDRCEKIGIIFQDSDNRIFSADVMDELAFAPENLRFSRDNIIERINHVADKLNIMHLLERGTQSLSGGEKQLIGIAAALVTKPAILIADEITSGLDKGAKGRVINFLKEYAAEGNTVIMVTHAAEELKIATKLINLDGVAV